MPRSTAPTSCSSSCASAGRRRGSSTRRCRRRFGMIGQETTGAGGFAKALRTVPLVLDLAELTARRAAKDAWIVDFTNPVGIVSQALLDDGPPGDRAVQRRDRLPARDGRAVRRGAGARPARARRAQPPDLGARRLRRRRRSAAGAHRTRRRRTSATSSALPGELVRTLGAIPSYYLRYYYQHRPGRRGAAGRPDPRPGGHGHRARAARDVPGPGPRREAGAAREPRRRVLQRGGGAAHRVAPRRRGRRPGRRRPQRRGTPRPARRRRGRGPGAGSIATARIPSRWRRWRPSMRGLVAGRQGVRASWPSRRP